MLSELHSLNLKLYSKPYNKIFVLHLTVVPQLCSGSWHNYSTKTRQAGHTDEQSMHSLMSMLTALISCVVCLWFRDIRCRDRLARFDPEFFFSRFNRLNNDESDFLEHELNQLKDGGFSWSHHLSNLSFFVSLTQTQNKLECVFQGTLIEGEGSVRLTSTLM